MEYIMILLSASTFLSHHQQTHQHFSTFISQTKIFKINPLYKTLTTMKLSLLTLSLIAGAAFSVAAPGSKGPKGPPGPPQGTVYGVSQSCSASQSSISCCNTRINGGNKKNVYYPGGNADLTCSQIDGKFSLHVCCFSALRSRCEVVADEGGVDVVCSWKGIKEPAGAGYLLFDGGLLHWRWMRRYCQLGWTLFHEQKIVRRVEDFGREEGFWLLAGGLSKPFLMACVTRRSLSVATWVRFGDLSDYVAL